MDVKPLIAELKARVVEELDYGLEADAQRAFAAAYAGDDADRRPAGGRQRAEGDRLRVARRARRCRGSSPTAPRSSATAPATCWPCCTSPVPQRAGLLHADPHPGNFRLLADGRLGVIDFGAVARLPDGHPEPIGRLLRWALAGKADEVLADLRAEGFVRPNVEVDAAGGARLPAAAAGAAGDASTSTSPAPGCRSRRPGSPTRATTPASSAAS